MRLLFLLTLVACAPTMQFSPFVERKPDPIKDQAAHRAPIEWWYVNGHLRSEDDEYGFALAIFQVYTPPQATFGLIPLQSLLPGPFYFGHFSLINKKTKDFLYTERSNLPISKLDNQGSASTEKMDVILDDWQIKRDNNYSLKASLNGKKLELELKLERPEVIHGPGWSGTTETGRMYYYSATRLEANGQLGNENVKGIAWFDHQWGGNDGNGGASFLPRWDWMSLQLDDGRDLMIYQLRDEKNQPIEPFISIYDGQTVRQLRDFQLTPWKFWRSTTGANYPIAWFLRFEDTVLTIEAVADNQEVQAEGTTGFAYYEGAVKVIGSSHGIGYIELTGYDSRPNPKSSLFR